MVMNATLPHNIRNVAAGSIAIHNGTIPDAIWEVAWSSAKSCLLQTSP
jgi:hypothetical protein